MFEDLSAMFAEFTDNLGLKTEILDNFVQAGIDEDLGSGDLTVESIVNAEKQGVARIFAKGEGVIAGLLLAWRVFYLLDNKVEVLKFVGDGTKVNTGDEILSLRGNAGKLLSAERTALNFLGKLSGIATLARRFMDEVKGLNVKVCDTRKTTPGWRVLEKYAVRTGGMTNHRMNLNDQVLIKENHLRASGMSLGDAVRKAVLGHQGIIIGAEAENLEEMMQAVNAGANYVLIDEFTHEDMKNAVKIRDELKLRTGKYVELEASGGITLENIRKAGETHVDRISLGAVTHSAKVFDLSCLFDGI